MEEGKSFEEYKQAAEQGDTNAQYRLAECYAYGDGTDEDEEKAFEWYKKSAEQRNAEAQYQLAYCYEAGKGTEQDEEESFYWYRKAAEQGNADAQCSLSICYRFGSGTSKNVEKAFEWAKRAAEQGDAGGQNKLAEYYCAGIGTSVNQEKAFAWWKKSAEQGDSHAQLALARCYASGEGTEIDKKKAFEWYKKAAEGEFPSLEAQTCLASCYGTGKGVEKDERKAFEWYQKAAEKGDIDAQFFLGAYYDAGKGTDVDKTQAARWFEKAAEQGHLQAQFNLGIYYGSGDIGIPVDKERAFVMFKNAAEHGHMDAQFMLGTSYYEGVYTKKDVAKAIEWLSKAAAQGHADAAKNLAYIRKNALAKTLSKLVDESDSLPDEQIIAEEEIPHEEKNPLEEIYSGEKFQEIKQLHETTLKKLADSGAMNKDKERLYKKFSERFLLANEKPAKIAVAKKSFAKNSTTDIPLVMYDETLSKNGELGYLLTNKKLYIGNREVDPIEVELASVNSIVAKPKLISSFIAIDDVQLEASSLLKEQLFAMADFLEKAVPLAMQIESVNEEVIEERPAEEPSISVSENPKEDIEALYVAVAQNGDESFTGRFFLSDSNPKKVIAAVKAYAKNCKGEEILVAYDDSAFGNGKVGFLLSNKKLYICNSFEKPQEIELSAVQSVSATPKSMNSFITVNDIKIDMTMVNGAAAELIAEFLQKAIPLAKQIEVQSE